MALALIFLFFLSAFGGEGLANTSDPMDPSLSAAITSTSEEAVKSFTAELLPDGLVLLSWSRDPTAISYLVMVNGKLNASLPASQLSVVVETLGTSESNGKFSIDSVNASNVQSTWVFKPVFLQPDTPPVTVPVEEPAPIETAPPVEEPAPIETAPPVGEPAPIETAPPVEEPALIETAPPVEEPIPTETAPPVEEPAPMVEVSPIELQNLAPDITDTSFNCDPVIESVFFVVGQTDHFTLSVTDESPLTLRYTVDSSNQGIVNVEVDEDGIFTISALQVGDIFIWLSAEDDKGLVDEYELRVVVQ